MPKKLKKNGFTLIECLVSILCDFVVMTLLLVFMNVCVHIVNIRTTQQDQFAILQLRQILATASERETSEGNLKLIYEHEEIEIKFDRNRIVRSPGYEILMENIESAQFYEMDKKIYFSFKKDKQEFTYQLY